MKKQKLNKNAIDPPPPPKCMCGQPGAFHVTIEVMELDLERDAGISALPYWRPNYRQGQGTRIATVMCGACLKTNVSLTVAAKANVERGQETS